MESCLHDSDELAGCALSGRDKPEIESDRWTSEFRGRKALLSGASRGLGKACAFALAREGVDVTIVAAHARRTGADRRGNRRGDRRQGDDGRRRHHHEGRTLCRTCGLSRPGYPPQQRRWPAARRFPRLVAGRLDRRARRDDAGADRNDAAHRRRHDDARLRPHHQYRLAQREDSAASSSACRTARAPASSASSPGWRARPLPQRHDQQSAAGDLRQRRAAGHINGMLAATGRASTSSGASARQPIRRGATAGRRSSGPIARFSAPNTPVSSPAKIC